MLGHARGFFDTCEHPHEIAGAPETTVIKRTPFSTSFGHQTTATIVVCMLSTNTVQPRSPAIPLTGPMLQALRLHFEGQIVGIDTSRKLVVLFIQIGPCSV